MIHAPLHRVNMHIDVCRWLPILDTFMRDMLHQPQKVTSMNGAGGDSSLSSQRVCVHML